MAPFFLMPRVFEFEMMLREDVVSAERMSILRAFLESLGIELPGQGSPRLFAPVSLRWRVSPQIGVPRVPFEVWRRPIEKRGPHRSLPINVSVTTDFTFEWGAAPLIELVCTASAASTLTVSTALESSSVQSSGWFGRVRAEISSSVVTWRTPCRGWGAASCLSKHPSAG